MANKLEYDAIVVGGGIAGMESSINLGDMGFNTLLVEKQASIGGKMILILLILFGCGILLEIAQEYLPKRTYNPMDIAANGLGLAAFYVCYHLTRIRSKAILNKSSRKGAETLRGE